MNPSLVPASHVICLADVSWQLRRIGIHVQRVGEVVLLALHHNIHLLNVISLQLQDGSSPRQRTVSRVVSDNADDDEENAIFAEGRGGGCPSQGGGAATAVLRKGEVAAL